MFDLDKQIISFIYNQCKTCGEAFGYGVLEGFILYIGLIVLAVFEGLKIRKNDK